MPPLPPAAERMPRDLPPVASKVPDAIEAEALLSAAKASGGKLRVQGMEEFGEAWSRDEQLWWTGAEPGDRLELPLEVPAGGRLRLRGQLTRAKDYGIVQLSLDGRALGAPIDLYHDGVVATGELDLGAIEAAPGPHLLGVAIVGANPAALPAHLVGIDYLRIVRAP
jgi:hypothetical protein